MVVFVDVASIVVAERGTVSGCQKDLTLHDPRFLRLVSTALDRSWKRALFSGLNINEVHQWLNK